MWSSSPTRKRLPSETLRSRAWVALAVVPLAVLGVGCDRADNTVGCLDYAWGQRGTTNGSLQKPRAMAIDPDDRIYIVDKTARIQVFDTDGHFLAGWRTPKCRDGKPTGLSIDNRGRLLVADTHYFRVLIYSPSGLLLQTIGGTPGHEPGQFGLVSDAVQDSQGNYYIAEFGEYDRIQKFSEDGDFLLQWGGPGSELGQFQRPQSLAIEEKDQIWVADACNHRIQVFDTEGKLLAHWGREGSGPGELSFPYDLVLAPDGTVYVSEFGNHRVQRFTRDGRSLGCWGAFGRKEGLLYNPWALVQDSQGRLYVLDTNNHRVQTIRM